MNDSSTKRIRAKARGPFIVSGTTTNGKLQMSRTPKQHNHLEEALAEANRLHGLYDKRFLVFGRVGQSAASTLVKTQRANSKLEKTLRLSVGDVCDSLILGNLFSLTEQVE